VAHVQIARVQAQGPGALQEEHRVLGAERLVAAPARQVEDLERVPRGIIEGLGAGVPLPPRPPAQQHDLLELGPARGDDLVEPLVPAQPEQPGMLPGILPRRDARHADASVVEVEELDRGQRSAEAERRGGQKDEEELDASGAIFGPLTSVSLAHVPLLTPGKYMSFY
jgi:hypothetical protein